MEKRNRIISYNPVLRARARDLRKNSTLGEALLWGALKNKALGCEFHRQVPIDRYIVDFFCHEKMLALEVDGCSHNHPETGANDVVRRERLESMGVRVIRFTEAEVRKDLNRVAAQIWSVVNEVDE
ncbi:MAG: DUF559 domain-containing protein [Candidatus Hydrogenedentes bacterium]|nr:DUF559 domain-containing protein [Candidatus Hydrogenedentota bacterium]